MKQNELQNDVTENNEQISGLIDLEPVAEVKGGVTQSGSTYKVTFGGVLTGVAGPGGNGHIKAFDGRD
jgi:hypothetical protein